MYVPECTLVTGQTPSVDQIPEYGLYMVTDVVNINALQIPPVAITILVDTAYVYSVPGFNVTRGIYMMDNQGSVGSSGEGGMQLHTSCIAGSLVSFNALPIDPTGNSGSVVILGFNTGNVFGSGYPVVQPAPGSQQNGSYWIGQVIAQGTETYQVFIQVDVGQLHPSAPRIIEWQATITST